MGLVSDSIGVTGEDTHEQLVDRTINAADNVLWTYKAHFEAADSFSNRSRRLDLGTTIGAALVTMALVWGEFPDFTIGVAILTAVISGYKTEQNRERRQIQTIVRGKPITSCSICIVISSRWSFRKILRM